MLDRVAETLSRYNMLSPGDRLGVAVSGGADSVCLLYAMHALALALNISLTVLHLNHCLRGAESETDADFVRGLADRLGLPFIGEAAEVGQVRDNLEQAGRRARQSFFSRVLNQHMVDRVATGHTRSDQAETVLFRILRGSGTAGLAGIAPVTENRIIRPLIDCDRSEILQFLQEREISWREDSTNTDTKFARNRIRHALIPELQASYSPSIVRILAATADIARDEEDYWNDQVASHAGLVFGSWRGSLTAKVANLAALHPALQRRLVRFAIKKTKGDLRGVGAAHIESVLRLLRSPRGTGRVQVPALDVVRSFDWLRFADRQNRADRAADFSFFITPPAFLRLPDTDLCLNVDLVESSGTDLTGNSYNGTSFLDFDRLEGPLAVRNWRAGDRYLGPGGEEKIKQLLQRARIPIWERRGWPVIANGDRVVWAGGFGAAADVAPDAGTRRLLRIQENAVRVSHESNGPRKASE